MKNNKGFTLIELMVVLVIIGALAAIVVPNFVGKGKDANIKATKMSIISISTGLKMFELDNGRFPTNDEGLDVLLYKKSSVPNWSSPYIEQKPFDAWKTPFKYNQTASFGMNFDLWSFGPDGKDDGGEGDDISNKPQ